MISRSSSDSRDHLVDPEQVVIEPGLNGQEGGPEGALYPSKRYTKGSGIKPTTTESTEEVQVEAWKIRTGWCW